ncbi:hypothetical protein CEUSTIGMA_g9703.t1 [Chlamydomonas eustigma]|uniref:Uncharacterized protein n=1 Tax=Chlamydomonas eustigma TaxID=1157962 RepID=A0A250XGS1_9CHLO|nr:hypothetical protein CEUSTIGMA_g9703.t1 [Chlamydomonas eustigma]|eukprot:GAX82274.1 hypothetical protein CEUSTIGMA_g9703.t1 [Chlamydomonas eustigma]
MRVKTELIQYLQSKCKTDDENILLETRLVRVAVEGLGEVSVLEKQLDEANDLLSLKPTLAKKLNDKIKSLQAEIEVLRSDTKVNELERKVQKLEAELKQSYATKNFTLRDGLLEIEKNYRDFIHQSEDVEELWGEIMHLLAEDREGLPPTSHNRRPRHRQSGEAGHGGSLSRPPPTVVGSVVKWSTVTLDPHAVLQQGPMVPPGDGDQHGTVHDQVVKYQEAGVGFSLPVDLAVAGVQMRGAGSQQHDSSRTWNPNILVPHIIHRDEPDARSLEIAPDTILASGQGSTAAVQETRGMYSSMMPPMSSMPASPLRPVNLFPNGVDASYLQQQADVMSACVAQLRELYSSVTHSSASTTHHGHRLPTNSDKDVDLKPNDGSVDSRRSPDARYFDNQAEELQVSLQELLKLYSDLGTWAASNASHPGPSTSAAAARRAADASYFTCKAEAVLSSIEHLRVLYSQQQDSSSTRPEAGRDPAVAETLDPSSGSVLDEVTCSQATASLNLKGEHLVANEGGAVPISRSFAVQAQRLVQIVAALKQSIETPSGYASPILPFPPLSSALPGSSACRVRNSSISGSAGTIGLSNRQGGKPLLLPTEPLVSLFGAFMAQMALQGEYPIGRGSSQKRTDEDQEEGNEVQAVSYMEQQRKRRRRKKKKATGAGGVPVQDDVEKGRNSYGGVTELTSKQMSVMINNQPAVQSSTHGPVGAVDQSAVRYEEGATSTHHDGTSSLKEDEEEEEEEEEEVAVPTVSELTVRFQQFIQSPAGLLSLPPAQLQALLTTYKEATSASSTPGPLSPAKSAVQATPAVYAAAASGAGAAGAWRQVQQQVEAGHAETLAQDPAAAALWKDVVAIMQEAEKVVMKPGTPVFDSSGGLSQQDLYPGGLSRQDLYPGGLSRQDLYPGGLTLAGTEAASLALFFSTGSNQQAGGLSPHDSSVLPAVAMYSHVGSNQQAGGLSPHDSSVLPAVAMYSHVGEVGSLQRRDAAFGSPAVSPTADYTASWSGGHDDEQEDRMRARRPSAGDRVLQVTEGGVLSEANAVRYDDHGLMKEQDRVLEDTAQAWVTTVVASNNVSSDESIAAQGALSDGGHSKTTKKYSEHQSEIQPIDETPVHGVGESGLMENTSPDEMNNGGNKSVLSFVEPEDENSVLEELRRLNMDYAVRLAEQEEALSYITKQQRLSQESADSLQARLSSLASETAALREDNQVLTSLLVETKVLYAEQQNENMRLQQRLKRSLLSENIIRNANEDLRLKLQQDVDLLGDEVAISGNSLLSELSLQNMTPTPPPASPPSTTSHDAVKV